MDEALAYDTLPTPIGELTVAVSVRGVAAISFDGEVAGARLVRDPAKARAAREELAAYFAGRLTRFTVRADLSGTPFQLAVWNALLEIPYGETRSYGDLAKVLGKPGAARAVGMANNRNRVGILVPCHRVIGAGGALVGYGGGLDRKRFLLDLERRSSR